MRVHIHLDDELVRRIDEQVGARRRSAFIADATRKALDDQRRRELIEAGIGSIPDTGHEWDDDPAAWVRAQRFADARRVG
jgi:Arc/MetJ-type ribon-helix-helix transcriptional regulator